MSNTDLHPEVIFYDFWINLGCIWGAFGIICWVQNASKNYVFVLNAFCMLSGSRAGGTQAGSAGGGGW